MYVRDRSYGQQQGRLLLEDVITARLSLKGHASVREMEPARYQGDQTVLKANESDERTQVSEVRSINGSFAVFQAEVKPQKVETAC